MRPYDLQTVVKETETIIKELAVQEKKQVQLEEKKKHAVNQQKKLKKSITDVRLWATTDVLVPLVLTPLPSRRLAGHPHSVERHLLGGQPRRDDRKVEEGARSTRGEAR